MLVKSKVGPWCSTPLFLPSVSTLVQVMFGVGLPEASQNNCRFERSLIVWSPLTLVRIAGTENNHTSAQFTYIIFVTKTTKLNICTCSLCTCTFTWCNTNNRLHFKRSYNFLSCHIGRVVNGPFKNMGLAKFL